MKIVIRPSLCEHVGSGRCERCLPNTVEGHRSGYCVMEEAEDGATVTTLVIEDAAGQVIETLTITSADELEVALADKGISLLSGD